MAEAKLNKAKAAVNIYNSFLADHKKNWVLKEFKKDAWYKLSGNAQLLKRYVENKLEETQDFSDYNRELQCLHLISHYVDKGIYKPFYVALMFISLGDPYSSIYKSFLNQLFTNDKTAWDQLFITIKDVDYTLVCT
jgi:hypothetical protein